MLFFATWPSRDVTYVAPREVQESIIRQWKEWYAQEGKTYPYHKAKSVDDWYF